MTERGDAVVPPKYYQKSIDMPIYILIENKKNITAVFEGFENGWIIQNYFVDLHLQKKNESPKFILTLLVWWLKGRISVLEKDLI